MNKQKFQEFLEEVAEIKVLKPSSSSTIRLDENSGGEVKFNGDWINIGKDSNPTLGIKFLKVKPQKRPCSLGCGKMVKDQQVDQHLCTYPKKHWRTKCKSCGCYVSPDGQAFIKGSHELQAAYMKHFNSDIPHANLDPDPQISNNPITIETDKGYTEIITNDSIIRKYR